MKKSTGPTPERLSASGTEDGHCVAFMAWANLPDNQIKYPELKWIFHIPNGGFRHKGEAAKLKAMGVKSGVSDYCLPVKRGKYSGLFIEFKRPKSAGKREGVTSVEQDLWGEHFKDQGYGYAVCTGWEQMRDVVISYLDWKEE